jgi:hypothetical protein
MIKYLSRKQNISVNLPAPNNPKQPADSAMALAGSIADYIAVELEEKNFEILSTS